MAAGESSAIIIEELTGDRRKVRLVGSGLPFRPVTWKVVQKLVTTWYPGNGDEATQQVLGPQDPPSEWEGMWRRTMLSRTPAVYSSGDAGDTKIVHPVTLRDIFDDMCRKGRRLRVTWTATDGQNIVNEQIVREGRISSFEWPVDRVDDIGWKISFEWVGRGVSQQKVITVRNGNMLADINSANASATALAAYAAYQRNISANRKIPRSANYLSLGQLEALTQAPNQWLTGVVRSAQQLANKLKQIGDIALKTRAIPLQLSNTVLAAATNAVCMANQFHDQLSRTPAELLTNKMRAADLARACKYFWGAGDATMQFGRANHDLRRNTTSPILRDSARTTRTIIAVHVVKAGETLMTISRRYYNTDDNAQDIARANRLPWDTVTPKRVTLIIPVLDTNKAA